ncbi:hypothetical protein Vretimale_13045 [Volvox reticuliferus]|uniref:Uncharacterized protein n=1 Tax=Volvox reticuliferus TaxID=1737510 RepID=A0A8J4LTN8_9CHLO|nr:hypothetical protein Vretimale_13045 [Volvox reticuliferus]
MATTNNMAKSQRSHHQVVCNAASLQLLLWAIVLFAFFGRTSALTVCKNYIGFVALPDTDRIGGDINCPVSTDEGFLRCRADPSCKSFITYLGCYQRSPIVLNTSIGSCLWYKPNCRAISGYSVTSDVDRDGDDIGSFGDLDTAAGRCNADPTCAAFNQLGFTKRSAAPLIQRTGYCFYSKQTTACKPILGYIVTPDMDRSGGDEIGFFGNDTANACSANPSCKEFNQTGWLKRGSGSLIPRPGNCLYAKQTVCKPIPGYSAQPDVDQSDPDGDDTIGAFPPVDNATSICNADSTCMGFNQLGVAKRSTTPLVKKQGACFYKKQTVCKPIPGYVATPDVDYTDGDVIGNFGNNASNVCSADNTCVGFNHLGVARTTITYINNLYVRSFADRPGYCFYSKQSVCNPIPGYNAIPDVDRTVDDIVCSTAVNTAVCDADPSCRSVLFYAGQQQGGCTKRSVAPLTKVIGFCLYVKKTVCRDIGGYTVTPDVDHDGDDISVGGTVNNCTSDAACVAFSTSNGGTLGSSKRSAAPLVAKPGNCFYVKKTACQSIAGYTAISDYDREGDDSGSYNSTSAAATSCTADPTCVAFNQRGITKRSTIPQIPKAGSCLYVKDTPGVCCVFIPTNAYTWQLVCNTPNNIPGAAPFPPSTTIGTLTAAPGQSALCSGRFPSPMSVPYYLLPANETRLYSSPNGVKCASQFSNFYQSVSPDGSFVVRCTN